MVGGYCSYIEVPALSDGSPFISVNRKELFLLNMKPQYLRQIIIVEVSRIIKSFMTPNVKTTGVVALATWLLYIAKDMISKVIFLNVNFVLMALHKAKLWHNKWIGKKVFYWVTLACTALQVKKVRYSFEQKAWVSLPLSPFPLFSPHTASLYFVWYSESLCLVSATAAWPLCLLANPGSVWWH